MNIENFQTTSKDVETSFSKSLKICHICGCVEAPTLTTVFDRRNSFSEQAGIFKKTEA